MADTEHISIIELAIDDARDGLALSAEAHWNQNEADWRFFLSKGVVFGVRENEQLIATAALLPYSFDNAWISMVLVTAGRRRRGIATLLVDACLNAARKLGLTTWLDATPEGAAVYGPLGFKPTLELRRLRLIRPSETKAPSLSAGRADQLIARDTAAMGFDRSPLLQEFAARSGSCIVSLGNAMAMVRDGRTARHIGPLFADTPERALALIDAIAQSETRPLLIDAVHSQAAFLGGLANAGWTIERPFQRMRFGRAMIESAAVPFAVAGPEYG